MRVVLDTNVFVSGVFFRGAPYEILRGWHDGKVEIVLSRSILEEYRRVTEKLAHRFPAIDIAPILDLLALKAIFYDPPVLAAPVCEDPSDDMFVACALAGRAGIIVSGDKHLLDISGYQGTWVLKPRTFVDLHLRRG